jgi:hypothetical protein
LNYSKYANFDKWQITMYEKIQKRIEGKNYSGNPNDEQGENWNV